MAISWFARLSALSMRSMIICLIRIYQRHLRRMHNRECIYTPTCSEYAILVIDKFGVIRGVRYAYVRIKRCNGALYQGWDDWP